MGSRDDGADAMQTEAMLSCLICGEKTAARTAECGRIRRVFADNVGQMSFLFCLDGLAVHKIKQKKSSPPLWEIKKALIPRSMSA